MATGGRMEFQIGFGRQPRRRERPEPDEPLRMLVCADLSGAAGTPGRPALRDRRALRVDVDNLAQVLGRIGPRVALTVDAAHASLSVGSIDDFHPDRLFGRLAPFAHQRQLRADLQDPARFELAAAALGAARAPSASRSPQAGPAQADSPQAAGESDFERLLGAPPAAIPATPAAEPAPLERWIRELVAPHVVPDTAGQMQMLVDSVDAAVAGLMRKVLRDPALRRLEAAWRGVDWLVRELGGEASVEIHLFDANRDELLDDVRESASDLSRSAFGQLLCGPRTEGPDGEPWSLVVIDHAFGPGADDVLLLAALGGIASHANAALLAGADPDLLGCPQVDALGDAASWTGLDAGPAARWSALRALDAAAWIALAAPRVLLRRPYGRRSEPVEAFAFEEIVDPRDAAGYLWGSPAFALALLAGSAFREEGWTMDPEARLDLEDLPAFSYRDEDEPRLRVCAEALVPERAGERMLEQGVMPLLGRRDRNALRLLRWQSIADPPQRLRGPWL